MRENGSDLDLTESGKASEFIVNVRRTKTNRKIRGFKFSNISYIYFISSIHIALLLIIIFFNII